VNKYVPLDEALDADPPDRRPPIGEPVARAPLKVISPADFLGEAVPRREWIVPDWLPCGVVTGLYGDGGLGKTLLAQQLQTATALGSPWLALPVERVPSLGVYCEDSSDELRRRQADISAGFGVDCDALGDVHWIPRLGEDNLLMTFARNGVGELTKFHSEIMAASLDFRARLVIVDTAADVFGGNENDRNHVRQFVSRALGLIAQKINGSVLLCAHPSRTGLSSGEGDGGSTGWSNTLRSRLFLRAPSVETGEVPDPNARILQRRKANYAARNDELRLRWRNGIIEPEALLPRGATPFGRREANDVFMDLLDEFAATEQRLSLSRNAVNYAPKLFAKLPQEQRHDYRVADFERAMRSLFTARKIENVPYGRKSDMRQMIVRARAEQ
jgi:RecA-family ATPase